MIEQIIIGYIILAIGWILCLSIIELMRYHTLHIIIIFWVSSFWVVTIPFLIWADHFDADIREQREYQKYVKSLTEDERLLMGDCIQRHLNKHSVLYAQELLFGQSEGNKLNEE